MSRLNRCVLDRNRATGMLSSTMGGGAYDCTLSHCILKVNYSGMYGGGADSSLLRNCIVVSNTAAGMGGGASLCTLQSCLLSFNSASQFGAAAYKCVADNCTIVRHPGTVGAINRGQLRNCVAWGNQSDWFSLAPPTNSAFNRTSQPLSGPGNITNDPLFVDADAGNFRLQPFSPCVDAGANITEDPRATDLDGNPRLFNGNVDMGCYEFTMNTAVKVFLQGPYSTNLHAMATNLYASGLIPSNAPYAADARVAETVPTGAADWVLAQLISTDKYESVAARSFFVRSDGSVVDDAGGDAVRLEAVPGHYYLSVKHRNHLAVMSASPLAYTNALVAYDFSTGSAQYMGGTDAAVELEPGVWGMIAGDADGDGKVTAVDGAICTSQVAKAGYKAGDIDLSGEVAAADVAACTNNRGRVSAAPNAETVFSSGLTVRPGRKTVLAEDSVTFAVANATNALTWFAIENPSGGTLTPVNSTSATYQAGTISSNVDVIEAWDGHYCFGRACVNVIDSADVAQAGKAVIIAGRKSLNDPLWPTTDYLADSAFNTLRYRGYSKANLQYLSPELYQDVDGNGAYDDVDLVTTLGNARLTFTNWANNANKLFVYLVDHGAEAGGQGYFRLSASEVLTATNLDAWLDDLQNKYNTEVTLVIDCCYSGSFLDEMDYTGAAKRVVIAACGSNEPSYFVAGGQVSFSDAFFAGVMLGYDVDACWNHAREAMETYQSAGMYENAAGATSNLYLGASFVAGKDIPQIGLVCGNQLLAGADTAVLWADDIASVYPLERVWCLVVPPGHDPDPANPVSDRVKTPTNEVAAGDGGRPAK